MADSICALGELQGGRLEGIYVVSCRSLFRCCFDSLELKYFLQPFGGVANEGSGYDSAKPAGTKSLALVSLIVQ